MSFISYAANDFCSPHCLFLFYLVFFLIISPPVTVLNAVRCTTRPQTVQPSANGWPNVLTTRRQQTTSARTLKMYVWHAHRRARSQSLSSLYAKRVLNDLMKPLSVGQQAKPNHCTPLSLQCPKCNICIEKNGGCNHMVSVNSFHGATLFTVANDFFLFPVSGPLFWLLPLSFVYSAMLQVQTR